MFDACNVHIMVDFATAFGTEDLMANDTTMTEWLTAIKAQARSTYYCRSWALLVWYCESKIKFRPYYNQDELQWLRIGQNSNSAIWCINVWITALHVITQTRSGRYRMIATDRRCYHQKPLTFFCRNRPSSRGLAAGRWPLDRKYGLAAVRIAANRAVKNMWLIRVESELIPSDVNHKVNN